MIQGCVNDSLEAVATVWVRSRDGLELAVDAIVETGYTGSLTLPESIVDQLELERQSRGLARMADSTIL